MALQYSIPRVQKFLVARKVLPMKRPIGMIVQLLEALVEPVSWQKERLGIRNMDRNGHLQRSTGFPHRIESPIIDLHERTFRNFLPQVKTQCLQHLQSPRSCLLGALDGIRLDSSVVGTGALIPQRFGDRYESVWVWFLKFFDRFVQPPA